MSENVERALEIVRNFTEAEFHSFMEMLYISETSQSNVSFNDLIGKNRIPFSKIEREGASLESLFVEVVGN